MINSEMWPIRARRRESKHSRSERNVNVKTVISEDYMLNMEAMTSSGEIVRLSLRLSRIESPQPH